MANLQKVVKLTQAQYNTLASGGTVGDYTGLDDNYIYLIEDTNTYITSDGGTIDGGDLTIEGNYFYVQDGYGVSVLDYSTGNVISALGGQYWSNEIIFNATDYYRPLFANDSYELIYSQNNDYLTDFTFSTGTLTVYDVYDTGCSIGLDAEEHKIFTEDYNYVLPERSGTLVLAPVSKTYTGLIGTSNNWIGCNFFFINVKPTSWQAEWTVRYRLECELDAGLSPTNGQYMHSTHECFVGGSRGLFNTFSNFNSINNTSYRVIGYGILAKTTEDGFTNNYGHMLGISLYYDGLAYQNQNVNYKRTIKVTVLEAVNCTATLENAPLISHNATRTDYTKLNATYYPYSSSESNTAGYLSTMDVYTQGLRETGDDNNTDLLYYHNQWTPISSNLGLAGYSLFGFNPAGEIMSISIADPSNPYQSEAVTTNRSYNTGGFDWARGLYRWTSGGYWAPSTTNLTHAYKVLTFNFKQTDNLVNAASTNLTMVANKFVYFRGTIGNDGLFYLAPMEVSYNSTTYKRAWTQDIPTTEDGYVYWLVGHAYSGGSATANLQDVRLYAENPLFWYKDGKFREYDPGYTGVKRYI